MGIKVPKNLLAIFLLVHGGVFLLVGIIVGSYNYYFKSTGIKTEGTIMDYVERRGGKESSTSFAPIVKFIALDGKTYQVEANVSTNPKTGEVGDTISIVYAAADPQHMMIDDFSSLFMIMIVFIIFGIIEVPIGLFLFKQYLEKKKDKPIANQGAVRIVPLK